jgi:hypothetical protein
MRRLVVTDSYGNIVATAPCPEDLDPVAPGAPEFVGFAPGEGQQVHTLMLPDDANSAEGLQDLHTRYRVDVSGSEPVFVRR